MADDEWALLLGNGFSRAYHDEIFNYDALLDAADLTERLEQIFATVGTSDFELVMRRLDQALALLNHYDIPADCRAEMKADLVHVRRSLITAIKAYHPEGAHELERTEYTKCGKFLGCFARIFTTNYDLLLYWVLLDQLTHKHEDGFRTNTWIGPVAEGQTVYYLHGALHLYDTGDSVKKLTRANGPRILEQLTKRMREGEYPLFVSEGDWRQKMMRIRANPYLLDAHECLVANDRPLAIYGFNFNQTDRHITNAIASSETPVLAVSIHSKATDANKERIMERARSLAGRINLPNGKNAECRFVESDKISVWN